MLTKDQVLHVAKLAKIELTGAEIEKFQKQLSAVIDYFDILKSVDTSSIPAKTHAMDISNRFQENRVGEKSISREQALKNASEKTDKYFVTDAVL